MHVVPRARPDGAQQGAVDPGDERAVELPWALEALPVFVHGGHEDIMHLQIPARVEQRQGIREALGGSPREMKPDVIRRGIQQIVEVLERETGRHMGLVAVVDRAKPLFEPEPGPDAAPERHSAIVIVERFGTGVEQAPHEAGKLGAGDAEFRREMPRRFRADVRTRLDHVQSAITPHELVERQVVVDVRDVDIERLEAEEATAS